MATHLDSPPQLSLAHEACEHEELEEHIGEIQCLAEQVGIAAERSKSSRDPTLLTVTVHFAEIGSGLLQLESLLLHIVLLANVKGLLHHGFEVDI